MSILDKIITHKKTELPALKEIIPHFNHVEHVRPSLYDALLAADHLQVIAEMKRASPSKGIIAQNVSPSEQAKKYELAGAACISVLTETKYFKGSYDDLYEVAKAVSIPVLCKDFIIDEVQIDYAQAAGASVILLIVAALSNAQLRGLHAYATALKLEVLVEVHNAEELKQALDIDAQLIGVNNRDLKTFEVDLTHSKEMGAKLVNSRAVFISESGIWTESDAALVASYGARAVLVGESLMRSETVEQDLRALKVPLKVAETL